MEDRYERLERLAKYIVAGQQRGMTRREFLRYGLGLGLSLPAVSAVLTGCGVDRPPVGQAPTAAFDPTATAAPSATPAPTAVPTATVAPTATTAPTATAEPARARLAVIGDYGWAGPAEAAVADLVKSWEPDFIVTTGDNNYPRGEAATIDANIGQYYHMYMQHSGSAYGPAAEVNRFFPVIGNHDTDVESGQPYHDYFVLPGNERFYTVDWPPVRIFAVNSVPWFEPAGVYADSEQALWLQQELAQASDRWKLVVFHHPAYSSGYRGSNSWMRWPFGEWGADAVLNGHHHAYERVMVDGLPYFTNGLGGGPRYAWGDEIVAGSEARFNADHGAMLIDADAQRVRFQFIAVGDRGLVDTFVIERG